MLNMSPDASDLSRWVVTRDAHSEGFSTGSSSELHPFLRTVTPWAHAHDWVSCVESMGCSSCFVCNVVTFFEFVAVIAVEVD